jgi:hypothetical protein
MQTESEQQYQAATQAVSKLNEANTAAAHLARELDGLAAREYDTTRKKEYEMRATRARAEATRLHSEVLKANGELGALARG